MSRSRKKAITKDIGIRKREYWRVHRRVNKQIVSRIDISDDEVLLKSPKEIVDDYDYCDYILDYEYTIKNIGTAEKIRRK